MHDTCHMFEKKSTVEMLFAYGKVSYEYDT